LLSHEAQISARVALVPASQRIVRFSHLFYRRKDHRAISADLAKSCVFLDGLEARAALLGETREKTPAWRHPASSPLFVLHLMPALPAKNFSRVKIDEPKKSMLCGEKASGYSRLDGARIVARSELYAPKSAGEITRTTRMVGSNYDLFCLGPRFFACEREKFKLAFGAPSTGSTR
jgi:hypothetical protein